MKFAIYIGAGVGGLMGSYLPELWHAGPLSAAGIIFGIIGTGAGIWAGYVLGQSIEV